MYAAEHVRLMEFCVQQVYSQLDQTNLESTYNYAKELQLTLLLRACEYFIITNQIPNYQVSELETQKITCASYDYHDRDYPHNPNPRHLTQQKVVIIGHHQCGKTTLWNLLLNRPFENKYQETTSFDFNYHVQTLPSGDFCNLQIWDSIGKEKFSNNVNMNHDMYYFHKTNILLLCFAFDDRTSFEYVRDYLFPKIDEDYNSKFHVMLLGLKLDCEHQVMRKEALG
jgi:small GTP-binding protein